MAKLLGGPFLEDPFFRAERESGLPLTCHTLREEFLEVLGASHQLHMRSYEGWVYERMFDETKDAEPDPDISLLIPATYAALVQKVSVTGEGFPRAWLCDPANIFAVFPRLKHLYVEQSESYDFTSELGDRLWSVRELEEHAKGPEVLAQVSEAYEDAKRAMMIGQESHIILTVEIELGYFEGIEERGEERHLVFQGCMLVSKRLLLVFVLAG